MSELEFLRPKTLEQALEYLKKGIPLAGGTNLTPRRDSLTRVVDLHELGLDRIDVEGPQVIIGATTTLQALMDSSTLPETLKDACRLEGGWNIRNMATIGGLIMSSDARSPLLTVLLALEAILSIEPEGKTQSLNKLLDVRDDVALITKIHFQLPEHLSYGQVARTPTDFPLVCAAFAEVTGNSKPRIAIGGFGDRPIPIEIGVGDRSPEEWVDAAGEEARARYSDAGDLWASAEYRSSIAKVLVKRLLSEVFLS
jgi:carbon-monoxide dehydrogenase medium subunit